MLLDEPDVFLTREHVAKHFLSDLRLKHVAALADLNLLGVLAVGRHVMFTHLLHELCEEAADRRLFVDVRIRQPAGYDATHVTLLFQKNHVRARAGR